MKQYKILPEIPTGFVLNPEKCYFSIIVPEDSTNYAYNPEQFNLNNIFMGVNADVYENDYNDVHYGYQSFNVKLTTGQWVENDVIGSLSADESYTFSISLKGTGQVKLYIGDGATALPSGGATYVTLTPYWTRYSHTVGSLPTTLVDPKLYVAYGDVESSFKVSAWQLENKPYATTFISGNLVSKTDKNGYLWLGNKNYSISTRTKQVLDGGRVINLKDIGFYLEGFVGLGMPELSYKTQPLSNDLGSYNLGKSLESRQFSIIGKLMAGSNISYFNFRNSFIELINNDLITFRLQLYDCKNSISREYELYSVYSTGLEGNYVNLYNEQLTINFTMFDPYIYETGNGVFKLDAINVLSGAMFSKNAVGEWTSSFNSGNKYIEKLRVLSDGNLYILSKDLEIFNGSTTTLLGTTNGFPLFILDAPDEYPANVTSLHAIKEVNSKIYLGGNFESFTLNTIVPQTINRRSLVIYDPINQTINDMGSTNGVVYAIEYIPTINKLLIGGNFNIVTNASGSSLTLNKAVDSSFNLILYDINTNSFSKISNAVDPEYATSFALSTWQYCYAIKYHNGKVYVGGRNIFYIYNIQFNRMDFAIDNINTRDRFLSVPSNIDVGSTGRHSVMTIEVSNDNIIYLGGFFDSTELSVESTTNFYTYEGVYSLAKYVNNKIVGVGLIANVAPLITSLTQPTPNEYGVGVVRDMVFTPENDLIFVGEFNHINNDPGLYGTGLVPLFKDPILACREDYLPNCGGMAKLSNGILSSYELQPYLYQFATELNLSTITTGGTLQNKKQSYSLGNTLHINAPINPKNVYIGTITGYNYPVNTLNPTLTTQGVVMSSPNTQDIIVKGEATYPIFDIVGLDILLSIVNQNSGGKINFDNKLLYPNEFFTIDLTQPFFNIYSTTGYEQTNFIAPGTILSNLKLFKGINYISANWQILNLLSIKDYIFIKWQNKYLSIDGIFVE